MESDIEEINDVIYQGWHVAVVDKTGDVYFMCDPHRHHNASLPNTVVTDMVDWSDGQPYTGRTERPPKRRRKCRVVISISDDEEKAKES